MKDLVNKYIFGDILKSVPLAGIYKYLWQIMGCINDNIEKLWTSGWRKSTKSAGRAQNNHEEISITIYSTIIIYRLDRYKIDTETEVTQ